MRKITCQSFSLCFADWVNYDTCQQKTLKCWIRTVECSYAFYKIDETCLLHKPIQGGYFWLLCKSFDNFLLRFHISPSALTGFCQPQVKLSRKWCARHWELKATACAYWLYYYGDNTTAAMVHHSTDAVHHTYLPPHTDYRGLRQSIQDSDRYYALRTKKTTG